MEKLVQLKKYLPEIAFVALLVRVLMAGAGVGEALAFISLVSSMAYSKWLEKSNDDRYLALEEKINFVEARVSSLYMEKGVRNTNEEKPKANILGQAKRHF